MTKSELENKNLADLHQLAAAAGVERYRMLTRAELIERLSDGEETDGGSQGDSGRSRGASGGEERRRERTSRRRRRPSTSGREREERTDVEAEEETPPRAEAPAATEGRSAGDQSTEEGTRPRRRRRRRRPFGRRREGLTIQDLLLPAEAGRQAVLLAETREAATELLRGVASDLASSSDGPDPVALLIDPSPEELADWKREASQAELVSAGQARHASDALSAVRRRAADGEDVILLIDSLTRFAESFGDADGAKELFDAGRGEEAAGKGSLTVVVVLERP